MFFFILQVFDVLFVKAQTERLHIVYCVDCARKQAPRLEGFVVLEEYHLTDLCQVYDNFVIHPVSTVPCVSVNSIFLFILILSLIKSISCINTSTKI